MVFLEVKVSSGAKKSQLVEYGEGRLKVKVHAVREKGKANEELITLLADFFDLPRSCISIVKGATSTVKLLCLQHIEEKILIQKLECLNSAS